MHLRHTSLIRTFSFTTIAGLVAIGAAQAADESGNAEARLREALRQLTVRVQTAESEAAALKVSQADLEARNKALAAEVERRINEVNTEKAEAAKAASAAAAKLADRDADLARTRETLDKWKAGHAQLTDKARKIEAARAGLAEKSAALDLRVADLVRKNLALYKIGNEILTRLENFSYGTALAAREPFVGTTRVKLENEVQGYKDKLLDPKLKP